MSEIDCTPEILRNKGIPCEFAVVIRGEDDWVKKYDETTNDFETETKFLRFNHNSIADIEDLWDGLPNWQIALEEKPVSTMRKTLAILLSVSNDEVGAMMIEGRLPEYNNAIGVSWAIANGVDPTIASRLIQQTKVTVDAQINIINQEMDNLIKTLEEDTPGESQ